MTLADLGLIGNCQLSALVRRDGAIVWSCMPRFDSVPVFAKLLDDRDGCAFTIAPADRRTGVQRYFPNTNVFETRFEAYSHVGFIHAAFASSSRLLLVGRSTAHERW